MNIGILTLPLNTNYGGILQAYALQVFLQRLGHQVFILDKSPYLKELSPCQKIIKYPLRYFANVVKGREVQSLHYEKLHNQSLHDDECTRVHTNRFIKNNMMLRSFQRIDELNVRDLDAIIVGSDQIWRKDYVKNALDSVEQGFLDFVKHRKKLKRISYAASFGTEKWEYDTKETRNVARLLSLFDAVSVREESAVTNIQKYLNRKDVKVMLDPTLLLTVDDYIKIVNKGETYKPSGNLMCYILDMDQEKQGFIDEISKVLGAEPFYANSKVEDNKAEKSERVQAPVEQWIRGFMEAEYVITDSFHACVFSILFQKPFLVLENSYRGLSRIESLLKMFGLEDRIVTTTMKTMPMVDYTRCNDILRQKRIEAKNYLINSL